MKRKEEVVVVVVVIVAVDPFVGRELREGVPHRSYTKSKQGKEEEGGREGR